MNEEALVRETVATIVTTILDVGRHSGDVDRITTRLLDEFDVLLETQERAARALLAFASLCADTLAYAAEPSVSTRTDDGAATRPLTYVARRP